MTFRAAALYARELRWPVVPLHDVSTGHCSCSEGAACKSAGKHPRVKEWEKEATADLAKINEWANRWPAANVGVATGTPSGFFVLDVDPEKGGFESFKALIEKHGPLPRTAQAATGSAGAHYLFKMPPGVDLRNTASKIAPGIDTRATAGQIVVAPSRSSKGPYTWNLNPLKGEPIADAPPWLLELLTTVAVTAAPAPPESRGFFPPASREVLDQAHDALEAHGPAIDGQGGGLHTVHAAAILTHDFALTDAEAWPLFVEWNKTARPPWELEGGNSLRVMLGRGRKYGKGEYGSKRALDVQARLQKLIADSLGGDPMQLVEAARPLFKQAGDVTRHALMVRELEAATGLKAKVLDLPPFLDAKAQARRAQFNAGEPGLLDSKAPHDNAKRFLREQSDSDGFPRVRTDVGGNVYAWRGHIWSSLADIEAAKEAYDFHAGKSDVLTGAPIKANQKTTSDFLHALKAEALAPSPPAWLKSVPGDPSPLEVVVFRNGWLHAKSRRFHAPSRRLFHVNAVEFDYDPHAPSPTGWLTFLGQLWPNDPESIATLQEIFGLALTADTSFQKMFLLIGPKRAGKGVILRVLTAMVGRANTASPSINSFGQYFGLEPLIGKSLVTLSDARLSSRTDNGAVVENFLRISGEDSVNVPQKHRLDWEGRLTARFFMVSNEAPAFLDQSGAMASRFIVLKVTNSFFGKEDAGLTGRLQDELPGITLWALDGLERLYARGHFLQPSSGAATLKELDTLASPIKAFVEECCTVGAGLSVECVALFDAWRTWDATRGSTRPGTIQMFGKNLSAAFPEVSVTRPRIGNAQQRHYSGIGLSRDESRHHQCSTQSEMKT